MLPVAFMSAKRGLLLWNKMLPTLFVIKSKAVPLHAMKALGGQEI
jgi:hypothetical protein